MALLADTHIHIYPCHDAGRLIMGAAARLRARGGERSAPVALFLTEVPGVNYFARLSDGTHGLPSSVEVTETPESGAVFLRVGDTAGVWIFAGHQVATAERLEVHALLQHEAPENGASADSIIETIHRAGGVAVLPWAAGKWLFRRAPVVRDLLIRYGPDQLLLGDSSLRGAMWPAPACFREPGRTILAGSDPLPLPGEEEQAGSYGVRITGAIDEAAPVSSLRRLLATPNPEIEQIGRRNTTVQMARRLWNLRRYRAISD